MQEHQVSRRNFLASSGIAASVAVGSQVGSNLAYAGPNERLSVGIVGAGQRGSSLLRTFFEISRNHNADLTAVCDLWTHHRERGGQQVQKATGRAPRLFRRLEDMLAMKGLDAVIIATPDHAHAIHLTEGVRAGKHVYCEKPFANVLDEAKTAVDAWRNAKCVVTVGTQFRSDPRYLAAAALVRDGVLGPVVKVERIFSAHSPFRWRRASDIKLLREADTDWRAFLLNKPFRRFDPHQYLEFRLFREFSSGVIDQWMSHGIDSVHMLTGARFPTSVVAHGGTYAWRDGRENGDTAHVLLEYPGFLCSHTTSLVNGFGTGGFILGRQGSMEFHTNWRVSGQGINDSKVEARAITAREAAVGDSNPILHMRNWLECIRKGQRQTNCTPEHGYAGAVACIMATQALQSGGRTLYDEKARTIRAA